MDRDDSTRDALPRSRLKALTLIAGHGQLPMPARSMHKSDDRGKSALAFPPARLRHNRRSESRSHRRYRSPGAQEATAHLSFATTTRSRRANRERSLGVRSPGVVPIFFIKNIDDVAQNHDTSLERLRRLDRNNF